ncbi:MAG: flagellar basal body P-ring formation chaperone FlgA [Pseudomonadota bacterium]
MFRLVAACLFALTTISQTAAGELALQPGDPLDQAGARQLLAEPLASALAADDVRIVIRQPALPLANPYADDAVLVLADLRMLPRDGFRAHVTIRTGDAAPMTLVLDGEATALVHVPVPATALPIGHVLTEADLETTLQPVGRVRKDWLLDVGVLAGQEARRPLAAGRPVTEAAVGAPYLVRRGDGVVVVYRKGNLVLELPARAEADGAMGDRIEVRNMTSGTRLVATVVGPGSLFLETGR